MGNGCTPDTDTESSLPTVGVVAALRELVEEMEERVRRGEAGAWGLGEAYLREQAGLFGVEG